ncbi:hypothetical protein [Cohnella silvisoli]|uniref:hypothetical protein n=1 Tax=Cohnella silvisoli TaxID=2873699 RepID=UPI0035A03338
MKAQLTPYLMSEDARTQAEAYRQALGGEILSVMAVRSNIHSIFSLGEPITAKS